jgi:hypothetical protein
MMGSTAQPSHDANVQSHPPVVDPMHLLIRASLTLAELGRKLEAFCCRSRHAAAIPVTLHS